MSNASLRVLESFHHPLPSLRKEDTLSVLSITAKTNSLDPPKFWIQGGNWEDKGNRILQEYGARLAPLSGDSINSKEDAIKIRLEADVLAAAAQYLVNPVSKVLSVLDSTFEYQAENTESSARTDKTFRFKSDTRRAILEYKRVGGIKPTEFEPALFSPRRDSQKNFQDDVASHAASAEKNPGKSYFKGNALKIMKQAGKYAMSHGTQYVAVFDWNYLVLIKFMEVNPKEEREQREDVGMGRYCEIQIIKEQPGTRLRTALLGFLSDAGGIPGAKDSRPPSPPDTDPKTNPAVQASSSKASSSKASGSQASGPKASGPKASSSEASGSQKTSSRKEPPAPASKSKERELPIRKNEKSSKRS